jgi:hypothetical protein
MNFTLPSASISAVVLAIYLAIASKKVQAQASAPFPPYSQMCQDDAGPPFVDDDETFGPGGKYHDGSAAYPILVGAGTNQCPSPLEAACSSRGPKTAYLEGPIDCGGKGWYCRILPDPDFAGINLAGDYNAHHCNNTEAPDDLHCHGGSVDETYYWWVRDHWFRQYNGRLRCCCGYDALRTERRITNRCDYRRLIQRGGANECRDANEDHDPNSPLFEAGCAEEATGPILEDDCKCWEVGNFGHVDGGGNPPPYKEVILGSPPECGAGPSSPTDKPTASPTKQPSASPQAAPVTDSPTVPPQSSPVDPPTLPPVSPSPTRAPVSPAPTDAPTDPPVDPPTDDDDYSDKRWVVCGRGTGCQEGDAKLVNEDEIHELRCCKDERGLGWTRRCREYDTNVFAKSKIFEECHETTFWEALELCWEADARLCTKAEVENLCTKGTGCQHDRDLIWTCTAENGDCSSHSECCSGTCNDNGECMRFDASW